MIAANSNTFRLRSSNPRANARGRNAAFPSSRPALSDHVVGASAVIRVGAPSPRSYGEQRSRNHPRAFGVVCLAARVLTPALPEGPGCTGMESLERLGPSPIESLSSEIRNCRPSYPVDERRGHPPTRHRWSLAAPAAPSPKKQPPARGACWELRDGELSRALVNATFNNEDDPGSAASRLVSVSTTPPERSMIALAAPAGLFTTGALHPSLVTVR